MSHDKNDKINLKVHGETNTLLALSKIVAVLITQPIQVIQRDQQRNFISAKDSFKQLYNKQPISAFYRGTGPGVIKEGLKNLFYKGALITGAPKLATNLLPQTLENYTSPLQYHLVKAGFAGLIAATSDACLGGFLESWATFRTTSQNEYANKGFFNEVKQQPSVISAIQRMYKGFVPTVFKGTIAFATLFALTDPIKDMTRYFYKLSPEDKTPWYSLGTSAIVCGIAVAITSSPFDIIKTQSQMPNGNNLGIYRALLNNYKMYGTVGITAGVPLKALQATIGWSLNFFASEYVQERNMYTALKITEEKIPETTSVSQVPYAQQ